jgi:hypothetical protein
MNLFLRLWSWLNSPHCFCDASGDICHHFEEGHTKAGYCPYCKHSEFCHWSEA